MTGDPRIGRGWATASDTALAATRANLLAGLGRVGEHVAAGTAHTVAPKRASTPVEAGAVILGLLIGLDHELAAREQAGTPT